MIDLKMCPYCAEEIKDEAIKCKHCGSMLEVEVAVSEDVSLHRDTSLKKKFLLGGMIFLAIIIIAATIVIGLRDTGGPTSVVGGFMIEIKKEDFKAARKYLGSDYSKTLSEFDLRSYSRRAKNENWLPDPDSIVIDENKAAERVTAFMDDGIKHYTFRLVKTFWGWKITGIH